MTNQPWWKGAVFYQIYPRSFADANGDGIGDLPGIVSKLDYLAWLGIDAIWLSPHYPSPQFDCGYDVADYTGVNPEYGSLDDFRGLLDGAHQRKMRILLDLVLNHTSDQHTWFQESHSSRDNPKRDWYIWRDGRDGGPPNNWESTFGGPAWELDPATGQYYYHFFFRQQPDLNWRNPEVQQAVFSAVRFWLDLGVDGFRLDAPGTLFEVEDLRDSDVPASLLQLYAQWQYGESEEVRLQAQQQLAYKFRFQEGQPELHRVLRDLRTVLDEYPDRYMVGETSDCRYYGDGRNELHSVFNFELLDLERLQADEIAKRLAVRLAKLPAEAWEANTLSNHDVSRSRSHFSDGVHDAEWTRLAAVLTLTLRGAPFIYNGEEIGMQDWPVSDPAQFRDMLSVWVYETVRAQMGLGEAEALQVANLKGRDKCRTPMQWGPRPNGDFCPAGVTPWLPVHPNHAQGVNVAQQREDATSLLQFYRRLIAVRKASPALTAGDFTLLESTQPGCLAYLRRANGQTVLVALNLSDRPQTNLLRAVKRWLANLRLRCLLSTHARSTNPESLPGLRLAPYEVYIGELVS